jgi:hypothetical protein
MPEYRYQFCDLRTDQHIVDLPLSGVRFGRQICGPGAFSASLPIPNRTMADQAAKVVPREHDDISRGPGRTICHVWRDDALWGSYIIWAARPRSTRGRISIEFRGATLESWMHRRFIAPSRSYSQVDQLTIARDLVYRTQYLTDEVDSPRTLTITLGGQASSGVLRDRSYSAQAHGTLGRRLEELSEVINGPEWYIRTYPDETGKRVREYVVAQVLGTGTVHRFSQPGNLLDWDWDIDASDAATYHHVRGGRNENGTLITTARESDAYWDAGWPRLDTVHEYPTLTSLATAGQYADWWVTHRSGPTRVLSATVRLGETPTLTPDHLGDPARLIIVNDWWPLDAAGSPTFDRIQRVMGMEVTPPTRDAPEEAQLIFEAPRADGAAADGYGVPEYPPAIAEMLARLPGDLREMLSGLRAS